MVFKKEVALHEIAKKFKLGDKYYVDFTFEGKFWRGTVNNIKTIWRGAELEFINVKLPNDGFIIPPTTQRVRMVI